MKELFYNTWEFNQALNIINTNPTLSKLKFEEYLEKYPKDYSAYTFYASLLITLSDLESAEKILNYVEDLVNKDEKYVKDILKFKSFKTDFLYSKVKLLCYQQKYDELYKIDLSDLKAKTDFDITSIIFYCKRKLGLLDLERRVPNSYLFRQIVKYEENDFFDHMKKHLYEYTQNIDTLNKAFFYEGFDLNTIVDEIKKYIPSSKKLRPGFIEDIYYFKYNECGKNNNKFANFIKVVCIKDTNEIITMYPIQITEDLPYVDLNYMIKEDKQKTNRLTRLDKFKLKYQKKDS